MTFVVDAIHIIFFFFGALYSLLASRSTITTDHRHNATHNGIDHDDDDAKSSNANKKNAYYNNG